MHKISYITITKKTGEIMYKMDFLMKEKMNCTPRTAEHCSILDYTETEVVSVKNCPDRYVKEPKQAHSLVSGDTI